MRAELMIFLQPVIIYLFLYVRSVDNINFLYKIYININNVQFDRIYVQFELELELFNQTVGKLSHVSKNFRWRTSKNQITDCSSRGTNVVERTENMNFAVG